MMHDAALFGSTRRTLVSTLIPFTFLWIAPHAGAAGDAAPTAPRLVSKRLDSLAENELRNRLVNTPQIALNRDEIDKLIDRYAGKFGAGRVGRLEPTTLLGVRPDFKQLPIRRGAYSRINPFDAAELTELSQKLKFYLELAVPKDMRGHRPDPARLREAMRAEKRGGTSPWLRPNAVPILVQQLGHDDLPIRMMLVELLSEIPGKEATIALARRAVFDLSPAAREAALKALVERPRDEVREVLLYGLSYPWAPAAEHAAEALVALKDREAVPQMVAILQKPDPNVPYLSDKNRVVMREVVRISHQANCLICHPPAISLGDPVPGIVPGVTFVTSTSSGGGGYGFSTFTLPQPRPLWIRADVAFLRQDFTIQLAPLLNAAGMPLPASVRTDFLVRERPLTDAEIKRYQSRPHSPEPSSQRQALLFALRELSGKNLGTSFEDWRTLAPSVDPDADAKALTEKLLQASVSRRKALLVRLQEGNNHGYTEALARAAAKLPGTAQGNAREALVARLARMPTPCLRDRLRDEDEEIQRAAIRACGRKNDKLLVPDLIAVIADGDPENARLASRSLRTLTAQDIGPAGEAPPEQWASAALAWEYWWKRQPEGK